MPEIEKIRTDSQLDQLFSDSERVPIWIFKHSLVCGVSSHALREFERFVDTVDPEDPAHFALVEVQTTPDVSRQVASHTGCPSRVPAAHSDPSWARWFGMSVIGRSAPNPWPAPGPAMRVG